MSQQSSINFDNQSSFFIEPPRTIANQATHSAAKSRFLSEDPQKSKSKMQRMCVDVVSEDRSNRMKVSNTFGNLMQNVPKSKVISISFMGAKRIGKSFLLDCILSHQSPPLGRSMCKSSPSPITTSFPPLPVGEQNNIVYLDCGGQISPQNFLVSYIISSVLVYNMSPNKHNEQSTLMEYLGYVYNRLQMEIGSEQILKPKLIIVKRDVSAKDSTQNDAQLFRKIEELKLLKSINIFHLPYPTSPSTPSKQICDLPPHLLSQNFLSQVVSLSNLLMTSPPKTIPYELTNRTVAPFLEHLLLGIEKNGAIDLAKIWKKVFEQESVNYYNSYLALYSQSMKKQLSNEEALTKYQMYRKLRAIKKQTDRKIGQVEGEDVGHFQEIKQKIHEFVKKKQQLVRGVNAAKSRQVHQSNWKSLIQKHSANNITSVVDEYIKNPLDDQKIEVLLQNFNELAQTRPEIQAPNIHATEMGILDAQLEQIERQVFSKSNLRQLPKLSNYQESLSMKKSQLQKIQQQYSHLAKQPNFVLDEGLVNLKQIQEQKQRLNQHIKDYENEIENLKEEKNRKVKESVLKLQKQLQMEEESLIRARQANKNVPYGSKVSNAGKVTKKTCCCTIM